MMNNSS